MTDSLIQPPPPLMIPILLRDLAGREVEAQGPLDAKEIVIALPQIPFGAFRFVPSGEKNALGRPIYVQESQRKPASAVIDTTAEKVE